jgi:vesicle-associated membrane protein 7
MREAFTFLLRLRGNFEKNYLPQVSDTVDSLKDNPSLLSDLKSEMLAIENSEGDTITLTQNELDQVRNIMVENVDRLLERGERITLLVSKTDRMNENAVTFRRRTVLVARHMWWQNVKFGALVAAAAIVCIYLAIGFVCGLPFFAYCRIEDDDPPALPSPPWNRI